MRTLEITSLANPRVKALAALAQKKERLETGLFVAEGLQLVGFGVDAGWELVTLVTLLEQPNHPVLQAARAVAGEELRVTGLIMEKLSRKDNPQGVLGIFKQRVQPLTTLRLAPDAVVVVLEEVRDPGNLGTIIRTADAAGASAVVLVGTCTDVWAPETIRATMGSVFHVPLVLTSREALLNWRAKQVCQLVGSHLQGAVPYTSLQRPKGQPLLLAMGTEQSGLSAELTAACDVLVKIPMRGRAESLNLAIATGVLLYAVLR